MESKKGYLSPDMVMYSTCGSVIMASGALDGTNTNGFDNEIDVGGGIK